MATSTKPKAVEGWAIIDPDGFMQMVAHCDSPKFIWRKFLMLKAYDEEEMQFYKKQGYKAVRVTITPQ